MSYTNYAQVQNFQWAKNIGGQGDDIGNGISTDANGNVFITGNFNSSSISFGNITLTNNTNLGGSIFIAKYDASGNALWAKSIPGGDFGGYKQGISTDVNGNVIITSHFSYNINFGSIILTNSDTSYITSDIFIAKYDGNGNLLWAKKAGGKGRDRVYSASNDANGNIFITGQFSSPNITFGNITLIDSTNLGCIFIAKYDASGNALWAKKSDGGGKGIGSSTDAKGNVFITGECSSSNIKFDTITLSNYPSNYPTSSNIFIAKYDGNGNVLWAKGAGGDSDDDISYGVSTDANGNAFITGNFKSPTITFGNTILSNSNYFIVKYDANGNVLWAKGALGYNSYIDEGWNISNESNGNVLVTGLFSSKSITFGSILLNNTSQSPNNFDFFITKYDASGNVIWAKGAFGINQDAGCGISTDANGNIFITGYSLSPNITFGGITLNNLGKSDVFIAKLSGITGVDELNKETDVLIAPNPFTSLVTFKFKSKINETINLVILDAVGKEVYSKNIESNIGENSITLNELNYLKTGIYFARLTNNDGISQLIKLVKN